MYGSTNNLNKYKSSICVITEYILFHMHQVHTYIYAHQTCAEKCTSTQSIIYPLVQVNSSINKHNKSAFQYVILSLISEIGDENFGRTSDTLQTRLNDTVDVS